VGKKFAQDKKNREKMAQGKEFKRNIRARAKKIFLHQGDRKKIHAR